jgi:hypothetical protein
MEKEAREKSESGAGTKGLDPKGKLIGNAIMSIGKV